MHCWPFYGLGLLIWICIQAATDDIVKAPQCCHRASTQLAGGNPLPCFGLPCRISSTAAAEGGHIQTRGKMVESARFQGLLHRV